MKKIRIISAVSALIAAMGIGTGAYAFSDMPQGEMGTALQNAVDVGLIQGVTDDTIAPYDNITRAQMATIITRAFSATDLSDTTFNDVDSTAWYAEAVSKAVKMGAFQGDDDNNFNPENNITFQETYLVLSRVFAFEPYTTRNGTVLGDCDPSVLDKFPDKDKLASWAFDGAKYMVGNGEWTGINGMLKPTDYITRGEFAILMDSIVDEYIDNPGTYPNLSDGVIMVRCGGVEIDRLKSQHNLIITYGVDERGCVVKNSVVNGVTLVLGGVDKSLKETKDSEGNTVYLPDQSHVQLTGNFYDVRLKNSGVYLDASAAKIQYFYGAEGSLCNFVINL